MNKVIPLLAILLWFCTACGEKKSTLVISDQPVSANCRKYVPGLTT